jgi:serine protease
MEASNKCMRLSRQPHRRIVLIGLYVFLALMACGGGGGDGQLSSTPGTSQFTLSGTVTASDIAAVDWDVNDANASNPSESNNGLSSTQPLVSPVSLAGFVSLEGDKSDFFSVSLLDQQLVTLYVADSASADIDLFLYDDLGVLLNSAVGNDAVETLTITADGDYIVEVKIVDMGNNQPASIQKSLYNLVIGTASSAIASKGMRLSDDFVSGEVIVRFVDQSYAVAGGNPQEGNRKAPDLGMEWVGGDLGRSMRMRFDSQTDNTAVFQSLAMPDETLERTARISDEDLRGKQRTLEVIKVLRQREDVLFAEPNYIRKTFITPNDTNFNLQWHYNLINLPEAWDLTTGSSDVIVAVVDTGVLVDHPDLAEKLTGTGYDFVSDVSFSGDGNGIDNNPDDPGDKASLNNTSTFHGTHVAGTIAAATDNNVGVAGAGWQTRVMAIRAMGLGGVGTDYDIAQGIRYAAGLANDSGTLPTRAADIINLSLGSGVNSTILADAIQAAENQGVIVIAAAGNESTNLPSYPAAYDTVVSVSAVDFAGNLAPYSNYGATISVAAPGGDTSADQNGDAIGDGVLSTLGRDESGTIEMVYGFYQGTSMAAPHVAGVAALMKAQQPAMTPSEFRVLLAGGNLTNDIGNADFFGSGLINAQKSVLAAQSGSLPTLLSTTPAILSLGTALTGAIITAQKIGDNSVDLNVTNVSSDAPWLSVTPATVDANGLGTYTVVGDRSGLSEGAYSGIITFTSSQNTSTVSMTMQVRTTTTSTDSGFHYIQLVDATTNEIVYELGVQSLNGIYNFTLAGVARGSYFLFAGTDLDDDDNVGDVGELTGAYRSLEQPQILVVDRNISGLNFVSEPNIRISQAGAAVRSR